MADSRFALEGLATEAGQPQRKRLRTKTPQPRQQAPEPQAVVGVELDEEADVGKARVVYLVTLPHPKQLTSASGQQLAAPGSKSRREILRIFLECCAELLYVNAVSRSRHEAIPIKHARVFSESSIARMQEAMIMRRLKVYSYERRIPKPPPRLSFCGRFFAHMLLNGGNPPPRP